MATENQKSLVNGDTTAVSLTHIERLYVQRGLDLIINANERSAKKEIPGSEFVRLREEETASIRALRSRFGGK